MRPPGNQNQLVRGPWPYALGSAMPLVVSVDGREALALPPYGTEAGKTRELRFLELHKNGSHSVGFKAPDAIAANVVWTLPAADGSSGQVLQTNGAGRLTFAAAGGGATQGCRVYNSANLSISHAVLTALTFDAERFDTDAMHSTTTNTGRITINTAGKYVVSASVKWNTLTGASYETKVRIRLNGSTYLAGQSCMWGGGVYEYSQIEQTVTTLYDLAQNDYLETVVYQNTGAALLVLASGNLSPEFSAHRLS